MAVIVFEYIKYNPFYVAPPDASIWWQPLESLRSWQAMMYIT